MKAHSPRPFGFVLSSVAALLLAAPTLAFPADSPTEPKLVFAAVGAVVFALSVLRIRREPTADAPPPAEPDDVTDR